MTYLEMFGITSKAWADVNDIKKIGYCGRDTATSILKEISNNILENGKRLPKGKTNVVPMNYVLDYFNLDTEYISNMAKKEKQLNF